MSGKKILKGTYCLLFELDETSSIRIGSLGIVEFKKGYYAYIGSALNSLKGRLDRHLREDKKLYWHVDYFLAHKNTKIVTIIYALNDDRFECELADKIADQGKSILNFGCSDCKCDSHLFFFNEYSKLEETCLKSFKELGLHPQRYKT
ncbi:MAG: GIY-YIG nuclease family protein [Methanobacterium sp.]|nr:GIY-YIG nuclease family protein [Methanobacterium sp.]